MAFKEIPRTVAAAAAAAAAAASGRGCRPDPTRPHPVPSQTRTSGTGRCVCAVLLSFERGPELVTVRDCLYLAPDDRRGRAGHVVLTLCDSQMDR